ncbi:BTAD domain-containing putative transcriptional regulator [Actinoplanes sp. N902-109]|uniref:BTAD domain-containing putative transcriptional regulator n=1 Tax=Actinoplanes sp. (strain N902-109) TaxID=649831 RepID=UPI0005A1B725|nr:BTAD domain-containing putative transcriptional regulator [Actinoplanes sp. N902-109]
MRRHALDAYTELADNTTSGHAIELLRAAATIDPMHEATHHRLITLLLEAGDRRAAHRLHDTYQDRLARNGLQAGAAFSLLTDRLSKPT